MSKAFTKDDADEAPLVPRRAPLPDGVPNHVTPRGLRLLRAEHTRLEAERRSADAQARDDGDGAPHRLAALDQRLADLAERIAGARPVDPARVATDQVRFATQVTLRTLDGERPGEVRRVQIVGVDEADPAAGRIAFTAPLARAVLGSEVGDVVTLETASGEEEIEVVAIEPLRDDG